MIITKKAMPRRTFLRGMGATLALPLLDAMIPAATASGQNAGQSRAPPGFRLHADGLRHHPLDSSRREHARRAFADPQFAGAGQGARHGHHAIWSCKTPIPAPCDLQLRLPERRQGEADRKHGLLPGHDGRSDRRQADRPGDATAVAGNVDGSAADGRPVRQRLRLRLSEQSFLVVADDAAAGRGSSADRV